MSSFVQGGQLKELSCGAGGGAGNGSNGAYGGGGTNAAGFGGAGGKASTGIINPWTTADVEPVINSPNSPVSLLRQKLNSINTRLSFQAKVKSDYQKSIADIEKSVETLLCEQAWYEKAIAHLVDLMDPLQRAAELGENWVTFTPPEGVSSVFAEIVRTGSPVQTKQKQGK